MPLIRVDNVGLAFGPHVLLENANLQLFKGDRVCLIGRNGAGKSTLMKLVSQQILPDNGTLWFRPGIKVARLEQELPPADERTVLEYVSEGLSEAQDLLTQYDELATQDLDEKGLARLSTLQHKLEALDGWSIQQTIDEILTRLALPREQRMNELSGGWRRRVALGQALVTNPDILLLDEPTNHLDMESIEALNLALDNYDGTLIFVSHDREFVSSLATRVIEIKDHELIDFQGTYEEYLARQEAQA